MTEHIDSFVTKMKGTLSSRFRSEIFGVLNSSGVDLSQLGVDEASSSEVLLAKLTDTFIETLPQHVREKMSIARGALSGLGSFEGKITGIGSVQSSRISSLGVGPDDVMASGLTRRQTIESIEADIEKLHIINGTDPSMRTVGGLDLNLLPRELVEGTSRKGSVGNVYSRLERAYGVQDVLHNFGAPTLSVTPEEHYLLGSHPYGVYDVDLTGAERDNPFAHFYGSTSLQGTDVGGAWEFGTHSYKKLSHWDDVASSGDRMSRAQTALIFDIETSGLSPDRSGIAQIAFQKATRGASGDLEMGPMQSYYFEHPSMDMASVIDPETGDPVSLGKAFLKERDPETGEWITHEATDFMTGMRDFLTQADEADVLAGHNIAGFDVSMVLRKLFNTPEVAGDALAHGRVAGDPEVQRLFGSLMDKAGLSSDIFQAPGSGEGIVDTLSMSRKYLADLPQSEDLLAMNVRTRHSLSNILLETNISSLLRDEDEGMYQRLISADTHRGDVDTAIEGILTRELDKMHRGVGSSLEITREGEYNLASDPRWRRGIIASNAAVPSAHLTREEIDPAIARQLDDMGDWRRRMVVDATGVDPSTGLIDTVARNPEERRLMDMGVHYVLDENGERALNLTGAEHNILLQRRDGFGVPTRAGNLNPQEVASRTNTWDRFSMYDPETRFLNRSQSAGVPLQGADTQIPTPQIFSQFQQRLTDASMPFANLSWQERDISVALSRAFSGVGMEDSERVARDTLSGTLPIPMIHAATDARVTGDLVGQRKAILPIGFLEEARDAGVLNIDLADPRNIQIGHFSRTLSSGVRAKDISWNAMLPQDETDFEEAMHKMGAWLSDEKYIDLQTRYPGLKGVSKEKLLAALRESKDYGIQIGTSLPATAKSGTPEVSRAFDVIDAIKEGQSRDSSGIQFGAGVSRVVTDSGKTKRLADVDHGTERILSAEMGPAILNKGVTDDLAGEYKTAAKASTKIYDDVSGLMQSPLMRHVFSLGDRAQEVPLAVKALDTMRKGAGYLSKYKKPSIAAGVGAAGLAYYMHRKRKEAKSEFYDEPFRQQPFEKKSNVTADLSGRAGNSRYTSSLDPLSTAGTVQNAWDNRQNHTNMSSGKNNHLFGGSR